MKQKSVILLEGMSSKEKKTREHKVGSFETNVSSTMVIKGLELMTEIKKQNKRD